MDFISLISSKKCKRKNNKFIQLLSSIWRNDGISRHELATKLNISRVATTRNIEQLLDWKMIEEAPALMSNGRGRRSVPLVLNKDLFYSAGISMHDEKLANIILINARSEIIEEILLKNMPPDWKGKCDYLIDKIKVLIKKHDIPFAKITGVGITLTGVTNPATGIVRYSSQFSEDTNFNLIEYFNTRLKTNCFMINISHLKAFIEHKWGKAKNMSSFLSFHSGFGLGMFLNGSLYRGHQHHGGEIGFMQIASNGVHGSDGRVGTLGELARFHKITDKIEKIISNGGKTEVRKYLPEGEEKVTMLMIVSAVEDGDQLCAQMVAESFEVIGRAILNLAYIFNPEAIFLPKWTARCPEVSLNVIRRMMGHYGVNNWELKTDILSAKCGNKDLTRGAAILPVENIFENEL